MKLLLEMLLLPKTKLLEVVFTRVDPEVPKVDDVADEAKIGMLCVLNQH